MEEIIKPGYKRITDTLWNFSGLKDVPKDILQNAADRGTRVHNVIEGLLTGVGFEPDDDTKPYVESFKRWWTDRETAVHIERRFYNDRFMITGKCDMIMKSSAGFQYLIDFKTSSKPSKTWEVQGCAYAYMAQEEGIRIDGIRFIHLDRKGGYPEVIPYRVNDDLFFAHMKIYNHYWGDNE